MSVFLDTNILVYATNEDSPYHSTAKRIIDQANNGIFQAVISPQVLSELYSTITSPKRVKYPLSPEDAYDAVKRFLECEAIFKIYPKEMTLNRALQLAKENNIKAQDFFDVLIVATMLDNGINTIYTANEDDFKRYKEITTYNPFINSL